jgi:Tol biopolymer transport system component
VIGIPFWSPDGRYLAFWSNNKLRKIEVAGGPSQALCDSSLVLGGFWTRDNKIVFGSQSSGLKQVAVEGGVASPITTLDSSRLDGQHILPSLLPDGRHFTYVSFRAAGADAGTYLGSLDAKPNQQSVKLILGGAAARYASLPGSAMGRLLFERDGSLMSQPFDPGRQELAGEPVPIAERVGNFSASENGVVLVYWNGPAGGPFASRQLTWMDRQGKVLGLATEPGIHNSIALSPDGTRIATARLEANPGGQTNLDVWLTDLARGASTRFTFFAGLDGVPIWSPDGSRIVFSSSRSAASDLYTHASNGAGADELLLHSDEIKYATDWSRDGGNLLYTNQGGKTGWDIWVLPGMNGAAADRKPQPFLQTEFNESGGMFSPDGRWVAYTSDESGKPEVYVQPFPATSGGGGKWQVSKGNGSQPRWRRDGKELFYLTFDNKLMAVDVTTAPAFKAGIPQALFDTHVVRSPVDQFIWDATADGRKFLVVTSAAADVSQPITVVVNWTAGMKH